MGQIAKKPELTLKALELFQTCAREGSLQGAADRLHLSISTISHHIRALEDHLGAEVFDHARRPMILTPTGRAFLGNIEGALTAIRKATAEATAGHKDGPTQLRIGVIEDLDSDITPELALHLSDQMPRCAFSFRTDTSSALLQLLRHRELDLAITTAPTERTSELVEYPLLKDPFVAVLPNGAEATPQQLLKGPQRLPFLRFSSKLMIARLIEAQLRRLGVSPEMRFECDNNQTLMGMVASGAGWTITTPLLFSRARRFHDALQLHPFPGRQFARTLCVVTTTDCPARVIERVDQQLRASILAHAVGPITADAPWLTGAFDLIAAPD